MKNFREWKAWQFVKQVAVDPVRRAHARIAYTDRIPLTWCLGRNWGDALSPILVELLSGRKPFHVEGLHHERYLAIGSILGGANERAEVWGSGFIRENETLIGRPRVVHAVRGPLSRSALIKQGVDCPKVYGDPALLLPQFFNPEVEKRYSVGIIPHYIDKRHPWLAPLRNDPQVLVLDIESGITDFVKAVKCCEVILSSSLHGLICADAYGIPNAWIRFSDDVIGGDFKFRDYRLSIAAGEPSAMAITLDTRLGVAVATAASHELRIDLRKLILACPFLDSELRNEIATAQSIACGLLGSLTTQTLD